MWRVLFCMLIFAFCLLHALLFCTFAMSLTRLLEAKQLIADSKWGIYYKLITNKDEEL
jgi:hypothetical protein